MTIGEKPYGHWAFIPRREITKMPSAADTYHTRWHRYFTARGNYSLLQGPGFDPAAQIARELDPMAKNASRDSIRRPEIAKL